MAVPIIFCIACGFAVTHNCPGCAQHSRQHGCDRLTSTWPTRVQFDWHQTAPPRQPSLLPSQSLDKGFQKTFCSAAVGYFKMRANQNAGRRFNLLHSGLPGNVWPSTPFSPKSFWPNSVVMFASIHLITWPLYITLAATSCNNGGNGQWTIQFDSRLNMMVIKKKTCKSLNDSYESASGFNTHYKPNLVLSCPI